MALGYHFQLSLLLPQKSLKEMIMEGKGNRLVKDGVVLIELLSLILSTESVFVSYTL
jgi:hypothetical protein